jgi:hypothetical protein
MNIDLILTEWCFRLPKGYPTQSKDYEVLYKVLLEIAKLSPADAQRIVERAQGLRKQIVTESIELNSIQNQINALSIDNKYKFKEYCSAIHEDTLIKTSDGLKRVKDIKIGEKLVTGGEVVGLIRREVNEICKLIQLILVERIQINQKNYRRHV